MNHSKSRPILYLAGPCGFSEIGTIGVAQLESKLAEKYEVINPFKKSEELGKQIVELEKKLLSKSTGQNLVSAIEIKDKLTQISMKIGQNNAEYIQEADLILAILDGSDVDSGTAAEIGYAYALGKRIYGYRSDFRYSGDNFGIIINLQVEYFIRASGGNIYHTLNELNF